MQINSIPNDKQLRLLLSGPYSHYTEFGPDDWRDPNKKNSSLSISSKGFFDHKSRESGSLCELCKQHNVPIAENIIQTHKKDLPQSIWDKSEVVKHSDSKSFQIAKSYFTKHRNIPLESYSDLLRKGLIRINKYRDVLMLVYPSLTPETADLAMESKPYGVKRIQKIFLNPDGSTHQKGKDI